MGVQGGGTETLEAGGISITFKPPPAAAAATKQAAQGQAQAHAVQPVPEPAAEPQLPMASRLASQRGPPALMEPAAGPEEEEARAEPEARDGPVDRSRAAGGSRPASVAGRQQAAAPAPAFGKQLLPAGLPPWHALWRRLGPTTAISTAPAALSAIPAHTASASSASSSAALEPTPGAAAPVWHLSGAFAVDAGPAATGHRVGRAPLAGAAAPALSSSAAATLRHAAATPTAAVGAAGLCP